MKILVLSNMYPSLDDPSFGTFVKNFYELISESNGKDATWLIAIKGKPKSLLEKIIKYFCFYLKATLSLLFNNYDLVYVHFLTYSIPPVKIASKFKKIPLVINIHGSDWITHSWIAARLKKMAIPLLLNSKLIVIPSFVFVDIIKKELPIINESKLYVSYSGGIDLELFKPLKKSSTHIVLGFVSRITELKGWRVFVEAIKILSIKGYEVRGVIVGEGEQFNELKDFISKNELTNKIQCLGALQPADLPKVYNQMTLFIFPTLYFESLGLVGLEAMACGVPVIGSNQGGLKEYIKEGENGYFFDVNNVNDLCSKVVKYLNLCDSDKKLMSENALKTASTFKNTLVMKELMLMIQQNILS